MLEKFKIIPGESTRLSHLETKGSHHFFSNENDAKEAIDDNIKKMEHLQQKLYSEGKKAILIIFQGNGYSR